MNTAAIAPAFIHSTVKRRNNVWYTVKDGNWNDPSIWQSNHAKRSAYPNQFGQIDNVYISHSVACNVTAIVNNLYISGSLTSATNFISLTVNGDIQCTGSISFTSSINLILYGVNNYIVSFTGGTTSTVTYTRAGDQYIMGLTYGNLVATNNIGTKYIQSGVDATGTFSTQAYTILQANLTLTGNLAVSPNFTNATFELATFNLTVGGTTNIAGAGNTFGLLSKNGAGSILFVGTLTALATSSGLISFSGNPTVELRGGFLFYPSLGGVNSGTGVWSFTTNNQTISSGGSFAASFDCPMIISGAITVTHVFASGSGGTRLTLASINGTVAGSTFINQARTYFTTSTIMSTGILDAANTSNAVIGYNMNGNFTIPLTSFQGLHTGGTGTKTLSGNTTVLTTLDNENAASVIELSTFNLTVNGSTNMNGTLSKTGAGAIVFGGIFNYGNSFVFSGNPTVELRGGMGITSGGVATGHNTGTGTWSFTTNNQAFQPYYTITFNGNVLISGAITVTATSLFVGPSIIFLGTLNGNNAASTLDNRTGVQYQNTQRPMLTGVLQTNAAANTFIYNKAGAQDITGGTYRTLTLAGSGIKVLQGNVVVATLYTLTAPATLNLNGFTRT